MKMKNMILMGTIILLALFTVGCLVSGTFVIVETFEFTTQSGFYPEAINLSDNADWEEHRDKLDKIEIVGFELWITNNESTEWSYWAYMDDYDMSCQDVTCAEASTTKFLIFDTLTVLPATATTQSTKYVSYAESFTYIKNLDKMKQMMFDGSFNFYGFAEGGTSGNGGAIDSIRVIITVNASDS